MIKNILKGMVIGIANVIPGVSGSMMLLLLGYYYPVLSAINSFISDLITLNIDGLLAECGVLVPFGIGVVVGIFAIAKLIEIIFTKFPLYAYWAIIGLIVASPIAIIAMGSFPVINVMTVFTGIVPLAVGFVIAMKLGD